MGFEDPIHPSVVTDNSVSAVIYTTKVDGPSKERGRKLFLLKGLSQNYLFFLAVNLHMCDSSMKH